MLIYAIDDEDNAREYLIDKIKRVEPDAEILDFNNAADALESVKSKPFDVAFLDIQMPKVNGVALAKKFKEINPKSNIIFVTGYSEYMADAFSLDASGYLLKPATKDQVAHALENLRYPIASADGPDMVIQCFGNFEIFCKGEPLHFKYNKSKEVVAYLVDRNGAVCANGEVITAIWEDDDKHDSYYRSLLKDIQDVFTEAGCKDVLSRQRAGAAIVTSKVRCDYYDFLAGKPAGINAYHGEYMNQYSWAEETAGSLFMDDEDF